MKKRIPQNLINLRQNIVGKSAKLPMQRGISIWAYMVICTLCFVVSGGQDFIVQNKKAVQDIMEGCTMEASPTCSKDTVERKTLRKLSRGHQFVVRAGGHIDMWTPLYV